MHDASALPLLGRPRSQSLTTASARPSQVFAVGDDVIGRRKRRITMMA